MNNSGQIVVDKNFKNQLCLLIIDKIIFGLIILAFSLSINTCIESNRRDAERRAQAAQSVSTVFIDVIVEERKEIKKNMEEFLKEVKSYQIHADPKRMDYKKLQELINDIKNSINLQIGDIAPNFPTKENVKLFIQQLISCRKFLKKDSADITTEGIKNELKEMKWAYTLFLDEIRETSIELALNEYDIVKRYLEEHDEEKKKARN